MTTPTIKPKVQGQGLHQEHAQRYYCAQCGAEVTSVKERLEIVGSHGHIFTNPAGKDFHLGCFASAQGCLIEGGATLDYTWFADFSWRFALCVGCKQHLGWYFDDTNGREFFGLILAELVQRN